MKVCFQHTCSHVAAPVDNLAISLSAPGYALSIFTEYEAVPESYWLLATHSEDFFLSKTYLQLLAAYPPEGTQPVYLLFSKDERPIGIAYGQLTTFRADEHIRTIANTESHWKKLLARQLHFRILVAGNMLLTGQHGFFFDHEVEEGMAGQLLQEAFRQTAKRVGDQSGSPAGILIKDLPVDNAIAVSLEASGAFQPLSFQPNMVLSLSSDWNRFEDYLADLTSKYRVRYRRARKKGQAVTCHELSLQQIRSFEKEIYQLYLDIANGADFCMTYLHPNYFSELKARTADDQFRLWGYFQDGQLIGFSTALWNGRDMEAHFLGLDQQYNTEYQLYLNMLYDLIHTGIAGRARRIIFSRTAMAIKSSVGAEAEEMTVLIGQVNRPWLQLLINPLIRLLEPPADWEKRHPFKTVPIVNAHIR